MKSKGFLGATAHSRAVVQHMKKNILILILIMLIGFFSEAQVEVNDSLWDKNDAEFKLEIKADFKIENSNKNTELKLYRDNQIILKDSIATTRLAKLFRDMNSDGNEDILIYERSGVRANETYNLYLYQPNSNDYKKVSGFNEIPNINTTDSKGILCSMILTGNVSYQFYFLTDNAELIDLKIRVTDENLDGKEYREGLIKAQKYVAQQRI